MNNKSARLPASPTITEDDIRSYAYHLYEQGNCQSGNDIAHWFEAAAFLRTDPTGQRPQLHPVSSRA